VHIPNTSVVISLSGGASLELSESLARASRMLGPRVDTTGIMAVSMLASVFIVGSFKEMVFIGQPFTKTTGEGLVFIAGSFGGMVFIGQPFTKMTSEGSVKFRGIKDNGLSSYQNL
jgi:hypothetical protein